MNLQWKQRTNAELQLFQNSDVVRFIKIYRLRLARHLGRIPKSQIIKKPLIEELFGRRPIRILYLRWAGNVAAYARSKLLIRDWKSAAQNKNDR